MAKATRLPKTVQVFTGVELILSEDEAQTLHTVCGLIGGDFQLSRRSHTASISRALSAAGYEWTSGGKGVEGFIYFKS